ncbi:MAG: SGNH/GDSL hydrolase family protein [Rhodothermia bacterium]|nr:SGNH/GDSL hydrolase family protein [Rhodothermia bacterium]
MAKSRGFRLLALGDSYTIGEGVSSEHCWPNLLAQQLRQSGFSCEPPVIIAQTGWTADELLKGLLTVNPTPSFHLVTLLIGVNNQYRGQSPSDYQQEATVLFREIRKVFLNIPLIVLAIPNWSLSPFAQGRNLDQITNDIEAFNRINQQLAHQFNGFWYNQIGLSTDRKTPLQGYTADGLHHDKDVYAHWARGIYGVLCRENFLAL